MSLLVFLLLARPGGGAGGAEASPPRVRARGAALEHACGRRHGATPGAGRKAALSSAAPQQQPPGLSSPFYFRNGDWSARCARPRVARLAPDCSSPSYLEPTYHRTHTSQTQATGVSAITYIQQSTCTVY